MNYFFILGASDPEMQAIEALLDQCGQPYAYAVGPDGERVHPGNAYQAEDVSATVGELLDQRMVWIECRPGTDILQDSDAVFIDHHRPGDPGYGRPPEEFMAASSIGQAISLLAHEGLLGWHLAHDVGTVGDAGHIHLHHGQYWVTVSAPCGYDWPMAVIPAEYVLAAAADHCLAHAYSGKCPGVDPDNLMRWRVASRAAFQGRSEADILAHVERARELLRHAPRMMVPILPDEQDGLGDSRTIDIRDMRGCNHCSGHGFATGSETGEHPCHGGPYGTVPELPEAAAREGICYVADAPGGRDPRKKVVCQCGSPEQIALFMSGELVPGLADYYGDPLRGFAGGYVAI